MSDESLDLAAALPPDLLAAAVEALGLPAARRDEAFASLRSANPRHDASLRRLFADFAGIERLLDRGYGQPSPTPDRFGPYRVLRRLGDGAFGEVFLCEQEEPVRRQVAVKVLRVGVGDRTTILRFAAERHLIASLQHPAIAQVFDAGTSGDGRPYFVMDAIDGLPLDRYCDEHALDVDARIELFCDLCRGVQHAHERSIVHRDLKPANVLVVEVDGRPRPKVIDFGIAKILHGSRVPRSFDTEAGRVVGTPGYMSPEQQQGSADDVDARADVFCLGVMLYELLCGQLPWAAGAAATDTDPQRPSTRVSADAATATAIARHRSTEPRRLANRLRGELDQIVLKCLQRDRAKRYQTARELVDDLERHRRGEPVRARPPSTVYRLRKYVRRHRVAVSAFGSAAVVAIVAVVGAQQFRRSASAEIDTATAKADARLADAEVAVARLLEAANDPNVREAPQGDAVRESMLRDVLSFYDRFLHERPRDPGLRAKRCRALLGLSHVHWLLGDATRAAESAQSAMQDGEALHAEDPMNPEFRGLVGEALCRRAFARSLAGDYTGALASFMAAIDHLAAAATALPAMFGLIHADALRGAAQSLDGHSGEARVRGLRAAVGALHGLRAVKPPIPGLADQFVLASLQLGEELCQVNAMPEAEAVLAETDSQLPMVTVAERFHLTGRVSALRALITGAAGQREEALVHLEKALQSAVAWQEAQPKRLQPRLALLRTLRQLGHTQNYAGDFDASVASFRRAIAVGEAAAESFPTDAKAVEGVVTALAQFALTLYDRFRLSVLDEAAACIERAVTLEARRGGASDQRWSLLALQASIADARAANGGECYWPLVEAALPSGLKPMGMTKDDLLGAYAGLARWHLHHGRTEAASAMLEKADALIASDPEYLAKRAVEVGWLSARLAAARADHAACASAAERVLAARPTWYGRRRAADCLHLAWRCAGNDGTEAAAAYRQRALDLYRQVGATLDGDVAKDASDPWFVVPWAIARIRAAELTAAAGDTVAALPLLATALPLLDALRADTHADQWDDQALAGGRALHAKLAGNSR
jgi:serine/threonine protein kinase